MHLKSVIDCFPYFSSNQSFQLLVYFIQVQDFPTVLGVIIVFLCCKHFPVKNSEEAHNIIYSYFLLNQLTLGSSNSIGDAVVKLLAGQL